MAYELRLEFLGGMAISQNGAPVSGFISAKAPALLCYLAVTGRPQFRLVLANLLWGELPEENACANLRKALSNLRDLLGDHLIITPRTVAWNRECAYWLDVETFLERAGSKSDSSAGVTSLRRDLTGCSAVSMSALISSTGVAHLIEAAELYRGDFLDGFYVHHAPMFEEWTLGQREMLRKLAGYVVRRLALHYAACDELDSAISYTSRWLTLDPWQEEAHRQMMSLLARAGDRSAALAQYEKCRRILGQELGVEPMAETTALYRRIRGMGGARPHNLPRPTTSFVGRQAELTLLLDRLDAPDCCLVSILGPPGIGKTRLALEAAARIRNRSDDTFPDGIFFVPLLNAHTRPALIAAIAAALGLTPPVAPAPQAELLRYLRNRDLLLVLDGFEHLAGEADLLTAIVQQAPQVKLLVTSRHRLNLQAEWPLMLEGLSYPSLDMAASLEAFGATQLFLQRARQACPEFTPSAADARAITLVCEMVEGLPLAIELAASATRSMSCVEIAQAIESNLDALSVLQSDFLPHHRSIRAAFEYSWRLLSPTEHRALCRLAGFHGCFTCESAEHRADVGATLLTVLVDKSLVRRGPAGYEMHELIRRFVVEKSAELTQRHSAKGGSHKAQAGRPQAATPR